MPRSLPIVLTNSELNTWRSCPHRWGLEYEEGLRPKVEAQPLRWGNMFHEGAAAGWSCASTGEIIRDTSNRVVASEVAVGTVIDMARYELENYVRQYLEALPDSDNVDELRKETQADAECVSWALGHYFESVKHDLQKIVLAVEQPFELKLPNSKGTARGSWITYSGKIDLVLWDPVMQRIEVQDHKGTGASIDTFERKLELDTQMTGYLVAVRHLLKTGQLTHPDLPKDAWKRTGLIQNNVIRRKIPGTPKLNKLTKKQCTREVHAAAMAYQESSGEPQGLVSVAQCDTTAVIYEDALALQVDDRCLDVTQAQADVFQRLQSRGDTFFGQYSFMRDDDEVERWRREVWVHGRHIRAAKKEPLERTRNPGACSLATSPRCPYAAVCQSNDSATRMDFRQAKQRHEELA